MNAIKTFFKDNKGMEFLDLICEFAGHTQYWKLRFSNDVLSEITKHYKLCGMICEIHRFEESSTDCGCPIENMYPCANCYSYGCCEFQNEDHARWEHISFDEIKNSNIHTTLIKCPYIPVETFMFITKDALKTEYYYTNKFDNVRNDLGVLLSEARVDFIKRNEVAFTGEIEYMKNLTYIRKTEFWWWRL